MSMEKKQIEQLRSRTEALTSQMSELNQEVQALKPQALAGDSSLLEEITAIENELGISLNAKERVGTWPINGPGSDACHWCTAGGGA